MTPKQTPSVQTPCLNVVSRLMNGRVADGVDTNPAEVLSTKYRQSTQESSRVGDKESNEFKCLPIAPGAHQKV